VELIVASKINLLQLETFVTVVRCGGIGKAAEQLNLTQPAVTTRIRNLEYAMSATLFERVSKGLLLTKRGELLLAYAEQFLHLSELVERDVVDPTGAERRLRLGVSETIAQSWLPQFIERLNEEFPKLSIEINVDISTALRQSLLDREVDLSILLGPVSEFSVDNIELPEFELSWYAAASLDLEEARKLNRPIASYARHTRPYRELKASLFEKIGPEVLIYPSSSLSACFRLVETGLCVAALPKALAQGYVDRGAIYEFDPGWVPSALRFTASYLADPKSHLIETAARISGEVAAIYIT
jgi:DNA-binding transcriptional LysR family regulator